MKKVLVMVWPAALLSALSALSWYKEWKYSLTVLFDQMALPSYGYSLPN